jgi:hypothetical protein
LKKEGSNSIEDLPADLNEDDLEAIREADALEG